MKFSIEKNHSVDSISAISRSFKDLSSMELFGIGDEIGKSVGDDAVFHYKEAKALADAFNKQDAGFFLKLSEKIPSCNTYTKQETFRYLDAIAPGASVIKSKFVPLAEKLARVSSPEDESIPALEASMKQLVMDTINKPSPSNPLNTMCNYGHGLDKFRNGNTSVVATKGRKLADLGFIMKNDYLKFLDFWNKRMETTFYDSFNVFVAHLNKAVINVYHSDRYSSLPGFFYAAWRMIHDGIIYQGRFLYPTASFTLLGICLASYAEKELGGKFLSL